MILWQFSGWQQPASRPRAPAPQRVRSPHPGTSAAQSGVLRKVWLVVSFGCSKHVRRPYAEVIDALRAGGLEKARRREMHVNGIDIDVRGGLPFGVEVVLLAEKALGVCATWHEDNARRLVEPVPHAVAPEKIDAGSHGKILPRLDRDRGKQVNHVDRRVDLG